MKIIIIQENGRHQKNRHFRECYSLQRAFNFHGHETCVWGLNHENFNMQPNWEDYDLIFNLENYDTSGWIPNLSRINTYKILWSIDAHCRGVDVFNETFRAGKYNLLLHSTRDFAVGKNRAWFPNAFDDDLVGKMKDIEKKYFIGFCGNYVNRRKMIDFMENKFSMKKDIFVIGEDMVKAINSYNIHFNKNISNDINYRSFETIACGTALLTNKNPQYEKLGFKDMENCIIYSDTNEMVEKLNFLIKNNDQIKKIQSLGYDLSTKHTYKIRVKKLLTFLKEKI